MRRTLVVLLVSMCLAAAYAQEAASSRAGSSSTSVPGHPASLQIKGGVTLNQRALSDVTNTVIAGDRIETGSAAVARISAPGLSIYVPENSCLKYNGQELELCNCGSVNVNSVQPVSVNLPESGVVVSSEGQDAAFTVSAAGRDLKLLSHHGVTEIARNGSLLTKLGASASRSFAGLGCTSPGMSRATAAGTAAALAAPAVITAAVLARTAKRTPLSSLNP